MAPAVAALAVGAAVVGLAGPAAYAIDTAATAHAGAIPSAGPATVGGTGAFGPARAARQRHRRGPARRELRRAAEAASTAPGPASEVARPAGRARRSPRRERAERGADRVARRDASQYRWVAATIGANAAAGYQLATNDAVMAIGGFNGTDPTPTLAQFQQYVADGDIHYFIGGGFGGGFGGRVRIVEREHVERDLGVGAGELLGDDRRRRHRYDLTASR